MKDCIFCKTAKKELPSHIIWEDKNFMAFLSVFPEVECMTIVIPKKHFDSYVFDVDKKVTCDLLAAATTVAKILDTKLKNVLRTSLVFEGLEVNHLHAKLFPIYKDKTRILPNDVKRASDEELAKVARKLKG